MTSRTHAPDGLLVVHGEYLPVDSGDTGIDLDVWGDVIAVFDVDRAPAP